MSDRVLLLVGTRKGGFVVESAPELRRWKVRGPYLAGQNVMHMNFDHRSGILFAAAWDWWFGSRVHRSFDQGSTWEEPISSPAFPPGAEWKQDKVWQVTPGRAHEPGVVYAGIEPAALFQSANDGRSWAWVESLSRHPTRQEWQPGAGGLTLHTVVLDQQRKDQVFAAISAAGLFRSDDGGDSWTAQTKGLPARNAFLNTLRDGMASDDLDPCGVYVGTNTGQVYYSRDTAGSWN